jgi:hypothetical protein
MIRKDVLDTHKLIYPANCYRAEDYGLWVEMLKYTKGANISSILLRYRKHENSETALSNKKTEEGITIGIRIKEQYMAQNGIFLKPEQMEIYTRFTDRAMPYKLTIDNQKSSEKVLKDFLSQFGQKQLKLQSEVIHHLSIICFYKFFINRRIPRTYLLQKLFFRGGFIYFKKLFLRK